ncbi:MAG: carboxypeptidase regulatory-like domain-containing protein [Gemmatimonadaceae bacterium]
MAAPLVTGVVVANADRSPLPHAMVSLQPLRRETFTDDRGRFSFANVMPGTYRLRIMHIGFSPSEVSLKVFGDSDMTRVTVGLDAVAVQLAAVHVTIDGPCVAPGAPDPSKDPGLAAIIEQIVMNAQQYRLLADSFPYSYRERREDYSVRGDSVVEGRRIDTLDLNSNDRRWKYRPGRVVTSSIFTRVHVMHLPTLADFASSEFVGSHCFRYGGELGTPEGPVVKVMFRVAARIRSADVNGTILLDAKSYQIRRADLQLSQIPFDLSKDFAAVEVSTTFGEIEPSVLVFSSVHGTSSLVPTPNRADYVETVEDQRLLDFAFIKADPRRGRNP